MEPTGANTLLYRRAHFVTQLPLNRLYSPSHCWLLEQQGIWRVGLTKFATRVLGEIVDYGFEVQPGATIKAGEVLGWIEGFKAVSDLLGVMDGEFKFVNPGLAERPDAIDRDCYGEGWLYEASGRPDGLCTDAHDYQAVLDATIDKLREQQQAPE